jgi:hypothetical protein
LNIVGVNASPQSESDLGYGGVHGRYEERVAVIQQRKRKRGIRSEKGVDQMSRHFIEAIGARNLIAHGHNERPADVREIDRARRHGPVHLEAQGGGGSLHGSGESRADDASAAAAEVRQSKLPVAGILVPHEVNVRSLRVDDQRSDTENGRSDVPFERGLEREGGRLTTSIEVREEVRAQFKRIGTAGHGSTRIQVVEGLSRDDRGASVNFSLIDRRARLRQPATSHDRPTLREADVHQIIRDQHTLFTHGVIGVAVGTFAGTVLRTPHLPAKARGIHTRRDPRSLVQQTGERLKAVGAVHILTAIKDNTATIAAHVGNRAANALVVLANVRALASSAINSISTAVINDCALSSEAIARSGTACACTREANLICAAFGTTRENSATAVFILTAFRVTKVCAVARSAGRFGGAAAMKNAAAAIIVNAISETIASERSTLA